MNEELVSIIIINFNTSKLTLECISSIIKFEKGRNIEIIVVDNASNTSDYENLEKGIINFPGVLLLKSKINLGFAAGNMFGYQFAKGEFITFINNDVLFIEPVIDSLTIFLNENPQAGVCGPQILNENKRETISFRHFEGIRYKIFGKTLFEFTSPNKPSVQKKYTSPIAVDFILGSFMMFKKEAFNTIGGFDINTFLYYEETDVCYRLLKQGYKTYFIPNLKYIHLEGKSSKNNLNLDLKLEHLLSYLYVTRKNFGPLKYTIIKAYVVLTYIVKAPFKAKNRFILKKIIFLNESLSKSLRHKQTIR